MGCCQSSGRGNSSSVYPSPTGEASSQHINTASPPRSSSIVNQTPRGSHGRRPQSAQHIQSPTTASGAPNTPLQGISPLSRSHTPKKARWTLSRWHRERDEFFDTRVNGRQETWLVVRTVTELLREGQVAEAQAMLNAAGCTCPTGQIWRGIYDELGAYYQVPDWVAMLPEEIIESSEEEPKSGDEAGAESGHESAAQGKEERKDEKGKGKAIDTQVQKEEVEKIKLRARLSDRGTDVVVKIGKDDKASVVIRRIKEAAELPPQAKVKIGYLGKVLHSDQSLAAQGWNESHIVNALVFTTE